MILRDFECPHCGKQFEELDASKAEVEAAKNSDWKPCVVCCPDCGTTATAIFNGKSATWCENMVPTYPGCKKQKAGYVHTSHADQAATRIQSGPGGCQGPSV